MAIFRPTSSKVSVQKVLLCPFQCKARRSGVSLVSPGLENIPQVPRNRSENAQNHDARKAISATLSVLKLSGAIFRPRSSKVGAQKFMLCAFQCKPRPSGVSLESPGLENIPKVAWNRAELGLTHDAREAVSASLSVWKWSGILFRPRSYKESVQKAFLSPFHWKPRHSGVSLEPAEMEYIPQVPANRPEVGENHDLRKTVSATLSVLK